MNATEMMEAFGDGGYDEESNDYMIEHLGEVTSISNNEHHLDVSKSGELELFKKKEDDQSDDLTDIIF